jgi:CRP-like cAMP-binding protein
MPESAKQTNKVENRLLAAMPRLEFERLRPHLELVNLPHGKILTEAGDTVRHTYFITSGMISLLMITKDGQTVEVAMVGREGVVGMPSVLRIQTTSFQAKVQIAAVAWRIKAEALRAEVKHCGSLHELMGCYTHTLVTQVAHSVACNLFHTTDQRLARWLLLAHDCAEEDSFGLTHEDISEMLGVSRSGVSTAASALQRKGMISYSRGRISILDRKGLESVACECYGSISEELDAYLKA